MEIVAIMLIAIIALCIWGWHHDVELMQKQIEELEKQIKKKSNQK